MAKNNGWIAFIILVVLIMGIFGAWKLGYIKKARDMWDDFNHVDEDDEGNDNLPPQDNSCSPLLKLGQNCNPDDPCCEDETVCGKQYFKWECRYLRPECENILPLNWSMDAYSYEEYKTILDLAEKMPEWYTWLNGENELNTDYAYELEQCMENHPEYIDYCCRCPDGTSTRFVYLKEQDKQYMWCFPNPN